MPELPEVETVRRGLEDLLLGKRIAAVRVELPRLVKGSTCTAFKQILSHRQLLAVNRRGKYLIFDFGDDVMLSHLRMEGKYLYFRDEVPENKHFHVFFTLTDGSTLVYQDVRQFGTMELLKKADLSTYFKNKGLGPEPRPDSFFIEPFQKRLAKSKKAIKSYLLDQTLVAGLGNIYVDEVLWAAKVHPLRLSSSLLLDETVALHKETIRILQLAIEKGGSTIRTYKNTLGEDGKMQDYLQVYGKEGHLCPRCASKIKKIKVGGRGSHFCPTCQVHD